ncbi:MAG: M3 family oligoendopeptidase [Candidatus Zambryskibacteria bacterium]|nr:M3 family oligoendopeptidase [Candidatus Zambryskibacteria bacterium]
MSKNKKISPKLAIEWNLSQLYKSPDDPQIEKDLIFIEKAYKIFANKYKKSNTYLKNEDALLRALLEYEKLADMPSSKSVFYLHLAQDINSKDQKIRAKMNLTSQRLQKIGNVVLFFDVTLSKIHLSLQKKFLLSKKLFPYRYFLKKLFEGGKHTLSEQEEKILSLKSLPSHYMWTESIKKIHNKQTIKHKNKDIPISKAESLIKELPTQKERKELHNKVMERFYELGDIAESEINAIVTDKKINDELRDFKEPYDATVLAYENDKETILNLVKTVTDSFPLVHRFYSIKAKMLKLRKLSYSDRNASVGKTKKKISFNQAYNILLNLFTSIDSRFGKILESFINDGQIDVYPKVGKTGGAYCSPDHKQPAFVLLNHTNTFESLRTFAHEMGHAIHGEFSKSQPVFYEGHSMSTAEVASTLFEYFLFYNQFEKLSDEEKVIALHDKIQDDVATIFRQIACFNFELEMHNTIREKGNMSKEELASCMNKHMKSYLGNKVELTEKDGYFFVGWPHIRSFFYVYSYAFGQLASKALYKKYQEDKSYIEKIKEFLSLGSSMSPEDIFKSIGVDVKRPDFFKKGIESIEEDIKLLETLVGGK